MTPVAFFDLAFLATLPGRTIEPAALDSRGTVRSGPLTLYEPSPYAHSVCVQPHEDKRKPLIEVDAVVLKDLLPNVVCDLGYGLAPSTVIDEGMLPIPDYHVLWPGKPTTNTVWTAVEDYTWFEAFSEEGCATGISCTPAPHMR